MKKAVLWRLSSRTHSSQLNKMVSNKLPNSAKWAVKRPVFALGINLDVWFDRKSRSGWRDLPRIAEKLPLEQPKMALSCEGWHRHVLAWPIIGQGFGIAIGTQQPGNICSTKNTLFVLPAILTLLFHWFSPFVLALPAQAGLPGQWTGPKGAIRSKQNLNNRKRFSTPAPHHLLFRQVTPTLPVGHLML